MDKLLKSILAILLLFTSLIIKGQIIPLEWEGIWHGTVDIWSYNVKTDSFPMSLEITPKDSVWNFVISYKRDVDKPDIRRYELIVVDKSRFHLAIDEKNTIYLDSYFNDNCLYTRFGGMGSDLQTRICMSKGDLEYEITSNLSEPIRVSGNEIIKSDTIPEIRSYDLYHIMKARLKKEE
jgi:hypothetical protein